MPEVEGTVDCRLLAQSDLLAKPLHSGHSNVVRIYHAKVRLSLEPDRHFLGQTGLWEFYGSAACWMVAVEKPVARHPPHRSVLAELPHTAPALSHDAKRADG
jgi:hypothetical protein